METHGELTNINRLSGDQLNRIARLENLEQQGFLQRGRYTRHTSSNTVPEKKIKSETIT
jgi:hypothetical protein